MISGSPDPSPSVAWRPAEEVIPVGPSVAEHEQTNDPRTINHVYMRRQGAMTPGIRLTATQPVTPSPPPVEAFIRKISMPLQTVLPTPKPAPTRHGLQTQVMTEPPHHSRCVAKLPPEHINPAAAFVCRQLGFGDDRTEATRDKYQKFWAAPFVRNHVNANNAWTRDAGEHGTCDGRLHHRCLTDVCWSSSLKLYQWMPQIF